MVDRLLPLRLQREALIRKGEKRVERAAADVVRLALTIARAAYNPDTATLDNALLDGRDIDFQPVLDEVEDLYWAAYLETAREVVEATLTTPVVSAGSLTAAEVSTENESHWHRDAAAVEAARLTRASAREARHASELEWLREKGVEHVQTDLVHRALEHLATVQNRMVRTPETVWDIIRADLATGLARGESVTDLALRVDDILSWTGSENWPARAVTISRTETIGAYNTGHRTGAFDTARQVGWTDEDVARIWTATYDSRTRTDHADADGLMVMGHEQYLVGGFAMNGPHDTEAPAKETVNCRCTERFLYPGMEGYPSDDVASMSRSDFTDPTTPRTRMVSQDEFNTLAAKGKAQLGAMRAHASAPAGLDANMGALQRQAYAATRSEWGGLTIDAHTGIPLAGTEDAFALTVRAPTMQSVSVGLGASEDEFAQAMAYARRKFSTELRNEGHYLGVFRDDAVGRIDFDPVLVVGSRADVDTIGAYTHAVGGAYCFADGNGYWPPFVGASVRGAGDAGLQGTGGVAHPGRSRTREGLPGSRPSRTVTRASAGGRAGGIMTTTITAAPPAPDTLPAHWPFHGVLAPEGLRTGDGRSFADGSLTWADLPLPFRIQNADQPGHDGAIRVGRIDNIWRDDTGDVTRIRYTGAWAEDEFGQLTDAAAAARQEVRNGSVRTVSVDLDTVTAEFVDSETGEAKTEEGGEDDFFDFLFGDPGLLVVTAGRIRSATACSIGAFQEAYIADGEMVEGREPGEGQEVPIVPTAAAAEQAAVKPAPPVGQPMRGMMPDGETECSCLADDPDYDPNCVCGEEAAAEEVVLEGDLDDLAHLTVGVDEFVSDKPWGDFTEADYTPAQWKRACLIHIAPAETPKSNHKVPVYEPGGALNRNGCHAAAGALAGARGGVDAPPDKKKAAANRLIGLYTRELKEDPPDSLYRAAGKTPPKRSSADSVAFAHLVAAVTIPVHPFETFADPMFRPGDGRMVRSPDTEDENGNTIPGTWGCPLTILDDGAVYGHLAKWGTCHVGFDGVCVTPPTSEASYAYFLTGALRTDVGDICVGQITVDTGHAASQLSAKAAVAHYDNTGTAVADIAVGDDEYGIWYAGRIRDNADPDKVQALRLAGAVSGDWRRIGTGLELVAALGVNVPGFPMPRLTLSAAGGVQTSLVAAGMVSPERVSDTVTVDDVTREVLARLDRRARAERLARRIGRDPLSRVAAAVAMIEEG